MTTVRVWHIMSYLVLNNGLIIQYGINGSIVGQTTVIVTFPISFESTHYSGCCTDWNNAQTQNFYIVSFGYTQRTISTIPMNANGRRGFGWIVIGK